MMLLPSGYDAISGTLSAVSVDIVPVTLKKASSQNYDILEFLRTQF